MKHNYSKLYINITIIFVVFVMALAVFSLPAIAQSDDNQQSVDTTTEKDEPETNKSTQAQDAQQQRRDNIETRKEERCNQIKSRLETIVDKIESRGENRDAKYQKILDKLNTLAQRLENNEFDASRLRAAIAELSSLVSEFNTSYQAYIANVQNAANIACNGDDQVKDVVARARSSLVDAKEDSREIRLYIQDSLKPVITDIKLLVSQQRNQTNQESEL